MSSTEALLRRVEETLLVDQVATDPQIFIGLYDFYFPRVYNYIRLRCGDPDTTDDLTALVFEQAFRKLGDYRADRAPFGAWLFAIARNTVNYHLRTQRRRPELPIDSCRHFSQDNPTPEESLIASEMRHELLAALEQMEDRERDLLSLKFATRLTNRRISGITGLSEANVAVILHRAVAKLRISLQRSMRHGDE